jgi:signal transduction histidine kinase
MTSISIEKLSVTTARRKGTEVLSIANETKDVVLAAIGHDLWPSLASIAGFADTLRRDSKALSNTQREAVNRIAANAERMEGMLRRMLAVSEDLRVMGAPGLSRFELGSVVTDVVRRARAHTQPLMMDLEPAQVEGSGALIERLVENLLTNAFLHTSPGSSVWIRVRGDEQMASLTVEDSGSGLPADLQVIDSAHVDVEGRPAPGMGLFLIERIARLHNGRFRIGDRPGGGARFVVELPRKGSSDLHIDSQPWAETQRVTLS